MKQFKENFKPEKIELIDNDGKSHVLNTLFLPSSKIKEIEKITEKYLSEEKGHVDFIFSVLKIMLGKDEVYWKKFSLDLLGDVVKYLRNVDEKKKLNDKWVYDLVLLKQNGFSVNEIDEMDYYQKISIIEMLKEENRKKDIKNQLLMAEVINFAYTGSQPKTKGNSNSHITAFANWKKKKIKELYPDYHEKNVWDTLKDVRQKRKKIVIG